MPVLMFRISFLLIFSDDYERRHGKVVHDSFVFVVFFVLSLLHDRKNMQIYPIAYCYLLFCLANRIFEVIHFVAWHLPAVNIEIRNNFFFV